MEVFKNLTVVWNQKVYHKYGYSEKYRNHMN